MVTMTFWAALLKWSWCVYWSPPGRLAWGSPRPLPSVLLGCTRHQSPAPTRWGRRQNHYVPKALTVGQKWGERSLSRKGKSVFTIPLCKQDACTLAPLLMSGSSLRPHVRWGCKLADAVSRGCRGGGKGIEFGQFWSLSAWQDTRSTSSAPMHPDQNSGSGLWQNLLTEQ